MPSYPVFYRLSSLDVGFEAVTYQISTMFLQPRCSIYLALEPWSLASKWTMTLVSTAESWPALVTDKRRFNGVVGAVRGVTKPKYNPFQSNNVDIARTFPPMPAKRPGPSLEIEFAINYSWPDTATASFFQARLARLHNSWGSSTLDGSKLRFCVSECGGAILFPTY